MTALLFWVGTFAFFVPLVLLAESADPLRQLMLGGFTATMLFLMCRSLLLPGRAVITAILIATVGECVLSLGWGLYEYRDVLIPLYVPFGHGIFYGLALATSERLPAAPMQRLPHVVVVVVSVYAVLNFALAGDELGLLWWVAAAMLIWRARNGRVLAVCCVYTMALEWLGTGLGNWHWAAIVPGSSLTAANPPSGVGLLYVVLDVLTVMVAGVSARRAATAE